MGGPKWPPKPPDRLRSFHRSARRQSAAHLALPPAPALLAHTLDSFHVDLHRGRGRDRTVEGSTVAVGLDQRLGLRLRDAGQLERHRDAGEPVRLRGGPDALDGHVHARERHTGIARVPFDQRHAAGRDAGQKGFAVREGVRLGSRGGIERQAVAARRIVRAPDGAAARRSDRVDHVGHINLLLSSRVRSHGCAGPDGRPAGRPPSRCASPSVA